MHVSLLFCKSTSLPDLACMVAYSVVVDSLALAVDSAVDGAGRSLAQRFRNARDWRL